MPIRETMSEAKKSRNNLASFLIVVILLLLSVIATLLWREFRMGRAVQHEVVDARDDWPTNINGTYKRKPRQARMNVWSNTNSANSNRLQNRTNNGQVFSFTDEFGVRNCPVALNLRFPGYFRTSSQQSEFRRLSMQRRNSVTVQARTTSARDCSVSCVSITPFFQAISLLKTEYGTSISPGRQITGNGNQNTKSLTDMRSPFAVRRRKRAAGTVYHGCCASESQFTSPSAMANVYGVQRKIAHLTFQRQYFNSETCRTVSNCNGCRCTQSMRVITAVYEKYSYASESERYDIDWFEVPGCCRCLN